MKKILLSFALLAATLTLSAQENFKFGNITPADFTQSNYAVDVTNADAIVLDELQQTYLMIFDYRNRKYSEKGDALVTQSTISRKIKILRSEGVRHAKITLDYFCDKATTPRHTSAYIGDIMAYSYSLKDGAIEKHTLTDDDIDARWLNDSTVRVEFTIPNVEQGSIIEYSYNAGKESVRPYTLNFAMQHDIPVINSRCEVAVSSERQPGMTKDDWYGVLISGKNLIKTSRSKGRIQREATSKVSHPIRDSFNGGYNTTGSWSGTRIYADCIFYNFSGKNLPATTSTTKPEDIAAISIILQSR